MKLEKMKVRRTSPPQPGDLSYISALTYSLLFIGFVLGVVLLAIGAFT